MLRFSNNTLSPKFTFILITFDCVHTGTFYGLFFKLTFSSLLLVRRSAKPSFFTFSFDFFHSTHRQLGRRPRASLLYRKICLFFSLTSWLFLAFKNILSLLHSSSPSSKCLLSLSAFDFSKDMARVCLSACSPRLVLQITDLIRWSVLWIPSTLGYLLRSLSQQGLIHQSCSSDTHITLCCSRWSCQETHFFFF